MVAVTGRSWRPYAAPAAALLAATLVVVLVRAGLQDGPASTPPPAKPAKAVVHKKAAVKHPAAKQTYVVRAGDTLGTIAAATGVSVARLEQLNPQIEPTSLFIGDQIRLR